MTFTNIPSPISSPWTDRYNQTWTWSGYAWVRLDNAIDAIEEAPKVVGDQYVRYSGTWVLSTPTYRYTGFAADNPITRPDGTSIQKGDTYFNSEIKANLAWHGDRWDIFGGITSITGVTTYYWKAHPAFLIGDELENTDDLGNTLPVEFLKETDVIILYIQGERLTEYVNSSVSADYKIDYAKSTITILRDFPIADVLLEYAILNTHGAKLHPYTKKIEQIGDKQYRISGGNFDQNTHIELDGSSAYATNITTISDNLLEFSLPTIPLGALIVKVINGNNRESFGSSLTLPTSQSNP